MKNRILLVNGPNLNLLGSREPEKYGTTTLRDIEEQITKLAEKSGFELYSFQSNHEGELIDFIHEKGKVSSAMILNPGAFTHTSVALRDAILGVALPFVEVHITNVYQRETFRHQSFFKDISVGQIVGLGTIGYRLALNAIIEKINHGEFG